MSSAQLLRPLRAAAGDARAVRVVTAAALFDGHDAAINVIRRFLQARGAEVIHLGHDRSVEDVVTAVVQEDADAVAVSSYQGGHMEYFTYLVAELARRGSAHVRVFGGGGGVISAEEVALLQRGGVARIFRPEDGQALGLEGMADYMLAEGRAARRAPAPPAAAALSLEDTASVARAITWFEDGPAEREAERVRRALDAARTGPRAPVLGFTGPGGAGKSSLVDEVVRRARQLQPDGRVGVLLVDPTRRRSGGALLGDRLRMNSIDARVFVRSLATRQAHRTVSASVADGIRVLQAAGASLIAVETAGTGQSDSEVVDLVDRSVYVMTPEYGAPSQLEKIDMLDLAAFVVLNKFDRRGGEDALRDVRRQWRRNRELRGEPAGEAPVYPTVASAWNDPGTEKFCRALFADLGFDPGLERAGAGRPELAGAAPLREVIVPDRRAQYLAEIADCVRGYRRGALEQARRAGLAQSLERSRAALAPADGSLAALERRAGELRESLDPRLRSQLEEWPQLRERYRAPAQSYRARGREVEVENSTRSLSGLPIARVALPGTENWEELARFLALENVPGRFPFTAGVFPFKRGDEEMPTRMFAGEGTPERTNRRFHLLSAGQPAVRLSTAFDSVTLYGRDPDERPDIWGKVGTSGVSVCSADDAKKLYSGFDLCAPNTSVSMTINGPAPIVLAFFFNAAIDQAVEKQLRESGQLEARLRAHFGSSPRPAYQGALPAGHDGLGLALLGVAGDALVDAGTYARIRADVLRRVRGTVQADILKEDQAQNTCIFSTAFALRLMGDVQAYFCANDVRSFYSVSISGYHIAEAGAFPITQLAFTLANAFTYCEYYQARGLAVDDFAPSFSFFFSNGLDPEYAVIGRVARRIWAIALRDYYGAGERSQKLKYHVQTSGRSLHAQEMAFNDIRTTLQALVALQDHCNSLHTNAYDEAVTTPTAESVRRALAIQLILQQEFGPMRNENGLQGSHFIEQLTEQVEDAVLEEFERISQRGGVLGAMETLYQRGRIQEESLRYESLKHSGALPIVGVTTFRDPAAESAPRVARELVRSSEEERRAQLEQRTAFQARHAGRSGPALARLREVAVRGENVFAELMETVKVATLGEIADALFDVGGRYRRNS